MTLWRAQGRCATAQAIQNRAIFKNELDFFHQKKIVKRHPLGFTILKFDIQSNHVYCFILKLRDNSLARPNTPGVSTHRRKKLFWSNVFPTRTVQRSSFVTMVKRSLSGAPDVKKQFRNLMRTRYTRVIKFHRMCPTLSILSRTTQELCWDEELAGA